MKKINILVLLCCLTIGKGWAQPAYKAALPTIPKDAFYAIDLPQQVLGCTLNDFSDIRIKNSDGKEVAWLLQEDVRSGHDSEFIPYQTSVTSATRRTNLLITTDRKPLSSFILKIKNADTEKEANLTGSNDGKQWFAVRETIRLNNISSTSETEALLYLNFPLSDYKYYKMAINDSLTTPLNIVGVGRIKDESFYERNLLEVPAQQVRMQEKGKWTEIELTYPYKYAIERVAFYISSPKFFSRTVNIAVPADVSWSNVLTHSNGNPQSFALGVEASALKLSVFNGDDQPLTIDSVKTYIRKYYLVAALQKGGNYTLTYGDPKATFPQYDLSFRHQLPAEIEHLTIKNIEQAAQLASPEAPSAWLVFLKKYGIWIIIAVVIVQILLMVRKLMK